MARVARVAKAIKDEHTTVPKVPRRGARNSSDSGAYAKAFAIANNPDFIAFFDTARNEILRELEGMTLDGSEKKERKALELVHDLHAMVRIRRTIMRPIAHERQKEANAVKRGAKVQG